ncbi:MAG: apolipoprotein N-acyltransferase, partial [Gemmatimonadota bacterium]
MSAGRASSHTFTGDRKARLGLTVLSALLLAASYPPLHPVVLPLLALAPFFAALWHVDDRSEAARLGAIFASVHFAVVGYWIPLALAEVTAAALPIALAGILLVAVGGGVTATLVFEVGRLRPATRVWSAATLWTGFEWILAHLPGSMAYPWLGLSTTLTGVPEWLGVAEVVGSWGVTAWIASINGLVAVAWLEWSRSGRRTLALGVLIFLTPVLGGYARAARFDADIEIPIAVLHTDRPAFPSEPGQATEATLLEAERRASEVVPGSVTLMAWPEGALDGTDESPGEVDALLRVQRLAREVGAPILFGLSDPDRGVNAALVMEPGGLSDFRYDKVRRVPFAEIPFWNAPERVDEPPLLEWDGRRFGVLICYESAFPAEARRARYAGADILVNVTNDAWSGGGGSRARTTAAWQHPAHLVLRAIETRTGVVRAANG